MLHYASFALRSMSQIDVIWYAILSVFIIKVA